MNEGKFEFRQSLFWDTDAKKLNSKKHSRYIIERVLDHGNDEEVRWLQKTYSRTIIKDVVKNSRVIQPQTRALWEILMKEK